MIRLYDTVDSTNDLALAAARADVQHGDCWVAEHQERGRGRREVGGDRRDWFSPRGLNLYMSVLLKPQDLEPARASGMTLAAGIGVCEALLHAVEDDLDIWLKWPNDIFIGTLKLGGVLTEAVTDSSGIQAIVVGIGLNVNVASDMVPEDLEDVMTSLAIETGHAHDRLELLHDVHDSVVTWCDAYVHRGWDALAAGLERWDQSDGKHVDVRDHGRHEHGIARGIDERGHLRVELESGEVVSLNTGEVQLRPGDTD